jgi:hypothetical protein
MKEILFTGALALLVAGCGKNEPGTMGGEPATPKTVATGSPAQAAAGSEVSNPKASAIESEHAMSSLEDSSQTNVTNSTLPQASTITTNATGQR